MTASRSTMPRGTLPLRARPGMVLTVPLDTQGSPRWSRAERDETEERRRREEGQDRLDRLKRRDPNGDIEI